MPMRQPPSGSTKKVADKLLLLRALGGRRRLASWQTVVHRSRKAGAPAIQETSAVKPAPVTALTCVLNDTLMSALGVAPQDTPGRLVVRHIGGSLVAVMKLAKGTAPPEAAEIVACECVVHAETKDPSEGLYKMIVDQV